MVLIQFSLSFYGQVSKSEKSSIPFPKIFHFSLNLTGEARRISFDKVNVYTNFFMTLTQGNEESM